MSDVQYDFAIIGVGVMGSNLLLNLADHGFAVIGYDLNPAKTKALEEEATKGTIVKGVNNIVEMVTLLKTPRKIMMLVPAGNPVDSVLADLAPHVQPGDIIMDGGNSHFTDTLRRVKALESTGLHFMGVGISGGEEGARIGPSIMPGGDKEAYEYLRPLLEAIAAKVNGRPCVDYLGKGAAGHYVKMVHNGIEYSIMQLICEAYDILKRLGNLDNDELHDVFKQWNDGDMHSFLIEITSYIFKQLDDETKQPLLDMILDKAGAKGTGKWTSQDALDIGVPIPCIDNAVAMRNISSLKAQRVQAAALYPRKALNDTIEKTELINIVHDALQFGILMSYAQGLAMLQVAGKDLGMDIHIEKVVNVWKGGCIIRSILLNVFDDVFAQEPDISNVLLHDSVSPIVQQVQQGARAAIGHAVRAGIPVGGIMAALNYFDAYTTKRLPTNLLQAQRDFFGAHTYEMVGKTGFFHTVWNSKPDEIVDAREAKKTFTETKP